MRTTEPINYNYQKLYGQGENAADIVLGFVPRNSRVLELGAGPGSITRRLKVEKGCRVTAVEIAECFLPHLAPHCERVVRADLNDAGWVNQVGVQEKFDTIVVADVLEHLTAPQEVLRACSSLLSPDGSVVISLPHIGHAVIYACLMDDNFDYREHGLLDSTHIRFFGLKNMQALIEGAGFKVVDVGFVCRAPEDTEYADQWRRAPPDLKAAILKNPHSNIYQCVMRVVRACAPGEPLDLMAQPSHVPRVTFLMLLNRVLKRVLPVTLYRFIRKVYEIISWITSKR